MVRSALVGLANVDGGYDGRGPFSDRLVAGPSTSLLSFGEGPQITSTKLIYVIRLLPMSPLAKPLKPSALSTGNLPGWRALPGQGLSGASSNCIQKSYRWLSQNNCFTTWTKRRSETARDSPCCTVLTIGRLICRCDWNAFGEVDGFSTVTKPWLRTDVLDNRFHR